MDRAEPTPISNVLFHMTFVSKGQNIMEKIAHRKLYFNQTHFKCLFSMDHICPARPGIALFTIEQSFNQMRYWVHGVKLGAHHKN